MNHPSEPGDTRQTLRDQLIRNFRNPPNVDEWKSGTRYEATDGDVVNRVLVKALGAAITTLPPGKKNCLVPITCTMPKPRCLWC